MGGRALPAGEHDFDCLHGSWRIVNARLTSRLTNSTDWESFVAEGACQSILGGGGNIDDFRPHSSGCQLTPRVLGRLADGEGESSADDGACWETNGTMAFTRDETR